MTKPILWVAALLMLVLAGCGGSVEHPSEEEVKAYLVGSYCSGDFRSRLELTADGRYSSKRNKKNPFGNGLIPEKCEGNFSLKYDEGSNVWSLEFATSDENSNPLVKCKASSMEIWKPKVGYIVGKDPIKLLEPFSQAEVRSDKCGDI